MEAEKFITEVAGCGQFQVWLTLMVYVVKLPAAFGFLMMTFGSYNPGWECVDDNGTYPHSLYDPINSSTSGHALASRPHYAIQPSAEENLKIDLLLQNGHINNSTTSTADTSSRDPKSEKDLCDVIYSKTCANIRFRPDVQTVVTEWALVCDKSWIPPTIISIELVGLTLSSNVAGHLADRYGRKTSMYTWVVLSIVTSLLSALSTSWEMLAAVTFFVGMSAGGNLAQTHIYPVEFVNAKWRSTITGLPSWQTCVLILGVCLMWLRNWRYVCYANAVVSFIALLTALWVPESMRWLLVHGKKDQANKVASKMFRYNKSDIRGLDPSALVASLDQEDGKPRKYTICDLFTRQLRRRTVLISLYNAFFSTAVFAIGFGIGSLFGDFFLNFIFYALIPIPVSFTGPLLANWIGRKWTLMIFNIIVLGSCVCIAVMHLTMDEEAVGLPTTYLALFLSVFLQVSLGVYNIFAAELFPTVVRSNGFSFALLIGRTASVSAPYILPQDVRASLTISFSIIGVLMICCVIILLGLPETRRRDLQDFILEKTVVINGGEAIN